MTSYAPNLVDLRGEAYRAGALANKVSKTLQATQFLFYRFALVPFLARDLKVLVAHLKATDLDGLSKEQLQGLMTLLLEMHGDLERMLDLVKRRPIHWFSAESKIYREIATHSEDLGDIVEAFSVSLSPAFRSRIDAALRQLPN